MRPAFFHPAKKMAKEAAESLVSVRDEARNLLAAIAEFYGPVRTDLLSQEERKLYFHILSIHAEAIHQLENYETMSLCELQAAVATVRGLSSGVVDETPGPEDRGDI